MFTSRYPLLPFLSPDDGAPSGGDNSPNDANPGGKQGESGEQKPYAVFPDERTFMSRVKRDAAATLKQQAEELGFASVDDMLAVVKDHKSRQEAEQSELDKLRTKAEQADQARKTALQTANARVVNAEARVQATALGIKPERVSAALRLADLSQVAVDDTGEPDGAAIKAALEAVLTDLPELKGEQGQRAAGGIPASPRGQAAPIPSREQLIAEEKARRRAQYGGF